MACMSNNIMLNDSSSSNSKMSSSSKSSSNESSDNRMMLDRQTSQYRPDELSVSVSGGVVSVEGKHEEKAEDGSKM